MTDIPTRFERLRGEAQAKIKAVDALLAEAKADRRSLTEDESAHAWSLVKEARDSASAAVRAKEAEGIRQAMADLLGPVGSPYMPSGSAAYGSPAAKAQLGSAWTEAMIKANSDHLGRYKALVPSGSVITALPAPAVTAMGTPVTGVRAIIPAEPTGGSYSFLKQTVRTTNARPVAPGAKKPTSIYTTALMEDRARVVAHLSESISRMDLADAPALSQFLELEMRAGLEQSIEDQIINGDGIGENFTGLANTSGVLTVAYATSLIATTRAAVTALELQGLPGSAWILSPTDWANIEMSASSTGNLLLTESGANVPIESASRRLWSKPVCVSVACPVGTAYFGDFAGSTKLFVREDARIDWSDALYDPARFGAGNGGTLFEANQVAMRVEARLNLAVLRPSGIVKLDLTETP
ncbi:HK97 family phage major capsid protein [Krasilnikovia cinnamomea]|uniref:HK97 family phage major capsid protein n=1 Tax=Krasilnikovia cinnamomea TaxID=349313 RepID=A0A4Q7ZQ54_9ACTN|nr:phage major capsid protein [Krasilnikovia cinnamomea]RZU52673.1 HK97 family phage major capsid protein [Krasilnikovia cinnamomea]